MTEQGELLHFMVDKILDRLDTPILEPLRDKIDIHIEQAFFCLYQHPSKKNKVEHTHRIYNIFITFLLGIKTFSGSQRESVAADMGSCRTTLPVLLPRSLARV